MVRTVLFSLAIASMVISVHPSAQGRSSQALQLVTRAAEAMGGREKILALKRITVEGYGQIAYQNGGGNITSSPDAPQKWIDVRDYARVIDFEHGRMRVRQRQLNAFVFAAAQNMKGIVAQQGLDGDVAFNINANGAAARVSAAAARARRMDMLADPVVIVRTALDPNAKLGNVRTAGGLGLVDVTTRGDTVTLAIDPATSLPAYVSWVGPDTNLGDVTYRAAFTGYEPVSGVLMPTGYTTTIDFRSIVLWKLYVDRHAADAPEVTAAPGVVSAAPIPVPQAPVIESTAVARGIWFLRGAGNSVLFEFDDHLTLFEVYASEANAKAIIDKARSLVPRKPLTEAIVSHHHFDHTGGLRAAVAEGLTIVMQKGNEAFIREVTSRPAKRFPDALGRNPRPLKFKAVDDHLTMKDGAMAIEIYRVVANSHMADGLMVYVPRDRLLVQGDLFDVNWDSYWWGSSYIDNVRHRNLQVERDVPVHGSILPLAEVQEAIAKQIKNAQALCASVDAAGLSMAGCPVKVTVDR